MVRPGESDHTNRTTDRSGRTGRLGRSPTQEELPLSTRVHELAKELGLKSQELLERIQKWGLDVKVRALARLDPSTAATVRVGALPSLDPSLVDRVIELVKQPATGNEPRSPAASPAHYPPSVKPTHRP